MIIGIQDEILHIHALGLLDRLLADKTTKGAILWATDAYQKEGKGYGRNEAITSGRITGEHSGIIKNRARKALEQQSRRTKKHAEVFTPVWVCKKMNDVADQAWFGRPGAFDPGSGTIHFEGGRTWQAYVDARRLEITCGEAPYLVGRYDVETGEHIPIKDRAGILDRKLRVVNANTTTEADWQYWTLRAFQATYGYEVQGDNLLIARVNLYMTFEEGCAARWGHPPDNTLGKKIATIIAWNLWQMDGMTGRTPFAATSGNQQVDMFSAFGLAAPAAPQNTPAECKVFNWRQGHSQIFAATRKGKGKMKFDFVIGNPPYQDETLGENDTYAPPVYHKFMDETYRIADKVVLIHPARFLFNAGSTPKDWNKKMLNDPHFKVLWYEQDSSAVFENTDIKGGIAITCHATNENYGAIGVFTPYPELNSILKKVRSNASFEGLNRIVITRTAYRLTEKMHEDHPEAMDQLSKGHAYDMSTNIFDRLPQIFYDEKPDDDYEYIQILGRKNNERIYKYIRHDYVNQVCNLDKYKVFIPSANGNGTLGEILSLPVLSNPAIGSTETFISIGSFNTKFEAKATLKYIKTKFTRVLLGVLKVTQHITPQKWAYVPLQDFTPSSDIDWTPSIPNIDRQLYAKYGLDETETAFIESHVKEMN